MMDTRFGDNWDRFLAEQDLVRISLILQNAHRRIHYSLCVYPMLRPIFQGNALVTFSQLFIPVDESKYANADP